MNILKFISFFILCSVTLLSYASDEEIAPFSTDGCSMFPDGTNKQPDLWKRCCLLHDLAYWQGGSFKQRLQADQALSACVTELGKPDVAKVMFAGVRIGGSPYLPSAYRWGYGWPFPRGYKIVSDTEFTQISPKLKRAADILDEHN